LRIYDTLAGRKKQFSPSGAVRILLCGPTVYDYSHVGHARMLLFYDLVVRYFRYRGFAVNAVVNITDIDPKVFARARDEEEGVAPPALADRFVAELLRDTSALGIDGFSFARVSDYVEVAKNAIRDLLHAGIAYCAGGNVYLDASRAGTGALSKMSRKDLEDCRLDIAPGKKSPSDILLWNASEYFDLSFADNVLGRGIPWWHMQDTSVAIANFGGTYDIHGGASELVYPHHESHLAQLRAIAGNDPVKLWTHTGLVRVRGEKMSKSLGNAVTVRDLLKRHTANAVRLYLLSRHYRDIIEYDEKGIARFDELDAAIAAHLDGAKGKPLLKEFLRCLENDFDTPAALAVIRKAITSKSRDLKIMASILGLGY
jgi:cysteinyl-tRNA synthetase